MTASSIILLGAFTRAHGLRGDLEVLPFNPDSPLWRAGSSFVRVPASLVPKRETDTVEVDIDRLTPLNLVSVRDGAKGRLIARFDAIDSRGEAEGAKGDLLGLAADALTDPGDGAFWFHEVPGWSVIDQERGEVGHVVRAISAAQDLLEVRPRQGGETFFIPVVDTFIVEVDRANRCFKVDLIEGLIP